MMRSELALSFSLLLTLAFVGCGGDAVSPTTPTATPTPTAGTPTTPGANPTPGGGSSTPAPPPAPAPAPAAAAAIASTSPKNGDTCVSQQPKIQVTFNSGSAPSTVTTDNFKVTGPAGEEDGQVTWAAASRTATWVTRPVNSRETTGPDLGMASNFTVTISGFTGGPYSFTFQTGPCGPPAVYSATT